MKLGVFVGSFNPMHNGHHDICKYVLDNKYVDKVILIPTPNYWDKNNLVDVDKRIHMMNFYADKNIIIDNKHNNLQYTYEILDVLKEENPNDELYLIIGADNICKFYEWKNIDRILENKVIVLNRDNIDIIKYIKEDDVDKFIVINNYKYIDVSSTKIRNGIYENIKKEVVNYIKENNLYGE